VITRNLTTNRRSRNEENCRCEYDENQTYFIGTTEIRCGDDVCLCVEKQLYYCATGAEAYKICCNPNPVTGNCAEGCHPKEFWLELDLGDECVRVEEMTS
jgi:hypothetical protein